MRSQEGFTLGICATGESPDLPALVESMLYEADSSAAGLQKLVVVASACPPETIAQLGSIRRRDLRLAVVEEEGRYGKAEAINQILALTDTPMVAFANADSRPSPGALSAIIKQLASDGRVGAVSAMPVPESGRGLTSALLDFMWNAHNRCSFTLNHMNIANHTCDELVAFRVDAIDFLPTDLVNDGAYLAARARQKGYGVKVCPSAEVGVKTPHRAVDVILQRRRILFGHAQVWRKMGTPPKTIESMLFLSPGIGMRILVRSLASSPRFLVALPAAAVSETLAAILSIYDVLTTSKAHVPWKRFR
ncbi:MAG: glycosyltransferase family 2 protein [Thaumarchaeota archaeon]|nr:glycosyltransferase family 2 protein [Nitrososphaerota archaeon]